MLGSSVLNHRQHVGLQKLVGLAGITHSSLGPTKKLKFIQDDSNGESVLVCSCHRILENLELTCAVGQLVYETVQAQQKVFNTGSGCLLFLAGAWSRVALECLHRGISASNIISSLREGIEICIDVCRKSSISTDDVGVTQSKSPQASAKAIAESSRAAFHLKGSTRVGVKTLNISGQRKIKLSRHFCAESESLSLASQSHQPQPPNTHHIAKGLRHGCINAMNLVLEVHQMQGQGLKDISSSTFDITKVMTCVLPGLPEERACVFPGCIILLSAEQTAVARLLKEQPLKVAFINGDLSHIFRHVGFKRSVRIQRVIEQSAMSGSGSDEEWLVKVMALLLNLEVNLIVVSGHVSENVIQCCCRHRILAVEKVKASSLSAIANATGGVPVTYASQLNKHCVGSGAKVTIWKDVSGTERKSSAVNISISGKSSGLVTVVLTSCVHGKLQLLEDQFWACAYRLHHALKDRALLPGAGVTEMLCIHQLQKQAVHHTRQKSEETGNPYRGEVLSLMAEGLIDYISTVMVNTGKFSKVAARTVVNQQLQDCAVLPDFAAKFSQLLLEDVTEDSSSTSATSHDSAQEVNVYDNLSVKVEAWRKALDLVFLVLQTDAEIITGVDQKTVGHQNLMLL